MRSFLKDNDNKTILAILQTRVLLGEQRILQLSQGKIAQYVILILVLKIRHRILMKRLTNEFVVHVKHTVLHGSNVILM